jgi:apolipoprotein D and lipocalin family protein
MRFFRRLSTVSVIGGTLGVSVVLANASDSAAKDTRPVTTVSEVDLERYAGRWYEITKIPNRFQRKCARGTTAEYALREDGRIDVVNRCMREDGRPEEARGIAKIVDPVSNAKLKVSFVSFLGWRPFWGDYWVIGLDEEYRWAVIGTPDRKYGWVLARSPVVDAKTIAEVREVLERNGYRWDEFESSPH